MTVTQKLNKLKYSKTLAFLLCVSILLECNFKGFDNLCGHRLFAKMVYDTVNPAKSDSTGFTFYAYFEFNVLQSVVQFRIRRRKDTLTALYKNMLKMNSLLNIEILNEVNKFNV